MSGCEGECTSPKKMGLSLYTFCLPFDRSFIHECSSSRGLFKVGRFLASLPPTHTFASESSLFFFCRFSFVDPRCKSAIHRWLQDQQLVPPCLPSNVFLIQNADFFSLCLSVSLASEKSGTGKKRSQWNRDVCECLPLCVFMKG